MDALIAEAERGDRYPGLRQIFGGAVVVNRMIGSLRRDDGGRDIGKIGKAPRRRLPLPAANEIGSIGLCLLFDFQLGRIIHRRIIGDRDVGNPQPAPFPYRTGYSRTAVRPARPRRPPFYAPERPFDRRGRHRPLDAQTVRACLAPLSGTLKATDRSGEPPLSQ